MLKFIKRCWRLFVINYTLARYGLGRWLLKSHLISRFSLLHLLIYCNIGHWQSKRDYQLGVALRSALEALGPIFIKFGQALSTRADLLSEDVIIELSLLQDRVAPFSGEVAQKIIEKTLNLPINQIFAEFDKQPLASASVAQVHAATMLDGRKVIVKILRPGIAELIEKDIDLLYSIAKIFERYWKEGRRLRLVAVVAEFERTLRDELDLVREAANASQLRRNFLDSDMLYIPQIDWRYTRKNILVQQRVYGIPVNNMAALKAQGVNFKKLAERGVEIFFTQVFRDCFFHADMHPGNIFINAEHPDNPMYIAVDFGIMGSLSDRDQHYLAENFLAFFKRDYRRVAELHIESGWVASNVRIDEFESAIRTVCEPIFEKPLKEISYGFVLLRLFQIGRRFNMAVQPQLVLLQKTLLAIEGLGRQLYPDLDLWNTAKPFLERWLRERVGPKAAWNKLKKIAPALMEQIPEIPILLHTVLQQKRLEQIHNTELLLQPHLQTKDLLLNKNTDHKRHYVYLLLFILGGILGYFLGHYK